MTGSLNHEASSGVMDLQSAPPVQRETAKVWDPLVRLFHWPLAGVILAARITADAWNRAHEWIGHVIGGLIAAHVAWSFIGTRHARFSDFVRGPRTVLHHIRQIHTGHAPRHLENNPAGGAMVIALMLMVTAIATIACMMTLDVFWIGEWMARFHALLFDGLLVVAGLHVAGIIHASTAHRENLVRAMIHGRTRP